jgi:hypothetical protein
MPRLLRLLPYSMPMWLVRRELKRAHGDPRRLTRATVRRYYDLMLGEGNRRAWLIRIWLTVLNFPVPKLEKVIAPTLLLWGEQGPADTARLCGPVSHGASTCLSGPASWDRSHASGRRSGGGAAGGRGFPGEVVSNKTNRDGSSVMAEPDQVIPCQCDRLPVEESPA